jgi:hypothetical protein
MQEKLKSRSWMDFYKRSWYLILLGKWYERKHYNKTTQRDLDMLYEDAVKWNRKLDNNCYQQKSHISILVYCSGFYILIQEKNIQCMDQNNHVKRTTECPGARQTNANKYKTYKNHQEEYKTWLLSLTMLKSSF